MALARSVTVIPARRRTRNVDTEEKERLKVAAYGRVSTDSEEQATSYEVQVEHYTSYIQNNLNGNLQVSMQTMVYLEQTQKSVNSLIK
ncbi:hypothetical protein [Pseudogracilibacillus auburnensis]|uniref:hypothetical protein n=1 Tax=Pseudogracilibacillus auburnensis TaxID=1494959 RepID=UPI003FD8DF12